MAISPERSWRAAFGSRHQEDAPAPDFYWSFAPEKLCSVLGTRPDGLGHTEADARLTRYGPNALVERRRAAPWRLFLSQFRSPLVMVLVFAAVVSIIVGEWTDAAIVLAVVLGSSVLGFVQEYSASNAVEQLRRQISIRSNVLRDRESRSIPSEQIVPGDIVLLSAGSLIPADGVLLEAGDFFRRRMGIASTKPDRRRKVS